MNFAIEVPGESNPLNTETLFRVLQSASSSDQQQVKTGSQQLQNWEKEPYYHSALQSLHVDYSLPVELRYLAVIQLKNGIDKYWRKTAANAIVKDEKVLIRSRSLRSGLDEPDPRLALQISIIIGKIIRFDYPQDWPDIIDAILDSLRRTSQLPGNPLYLLRILLILLYAVKELSTARLQRSRTKLQSITPAIIQCLSTVYFTKVSKWRTFLKQGGEDEGGALASIEQSLLAIRTLRRLIVAGYDFPNRDRDMCDIWTSFASQFADILAMVQGTSNFVHTGPQRLIEKHLVQISKLHVDMAKSHPTGYSLLPHSDELTRAYWGLIQRFSENYGSQSAGKSQSIGTDGDVEDDYESSTLEKVSLKGLLLIRACVKMVFNPAQVIRFQQAEDKEERKQAKESMRSKLLTERFAEEMMATLVSRFFVFTPQDMRQWEEEPDEWEKSQEGVGEDWEFSIRTCSEKLFLDLMINYKERLVPPLLNIFNHVASERIFSFTVRGTYTNKVRCTKQ